VILLVFKLGSFVIFLFLTGFTGSVLDRITGFTIFVVFNCRLEAVITLDARTAVERFSGISGSMRSLRSRFGLLWRRDVRVAIWVCLGLFFKQSAANSEQ
jgi:hypothetical protein